ncbi:MAG TPA: hypothetical protein VM308_10360 [Sphingomicrobium sp.]|nr:hypothetical protein [Sphingomicrobium sp.]
MELVSPAPARSAGLRFRLPKCVPPFNTPAYRIFSIIWAAAFLLALAGPIAGLYLRYTAPENNSQLLLGSHAGFAVSPGDATRIRFPVSAEAARAGIQPGDRIVAIYGLPLPQRMPVTEQALAANAGDPAYIAMNNLLFSTDNGEVPITLRSPDGEVREITVTTGEHHIDAGARALGVSPKVLKFIDLLQILAYPFLLWAAWILHRRNARDAVSSLLSLAVLLSIGSEQPSVTALANLSAPRSVTVALFDLANVLLLAGILLFPHGELGWRKVALLACLPILIFLHGQAYQAFFICFMIIAVLSLLRRMRSAPSGDLQQQIRWALFGFSGYALLRGISIIADLLKWSTGSLGQQLAVEIFAGVCFALGTLVLQLGLLVALLKYRLYDAESIISKTVSVALITLILSAGFAAVMEGIITGVQFIYPESDTSQTLAAMAGAVVAAGMIEPIRDRVKRWTERYFHRGLTDLKHGLPETMRDLRDVTSFDNFIDEVLSRIAEGLLAGRMAFVLGREVKHQIGVTRGEVLRWLAAFQPHEGKERIETDLDDRLFPLRVRVEDGSGSVVGWLLVGPRPDGSVAGKDEREAIDDIIVPFARSLRVVLNREKERKEMIELLEAHRLRIERLELALRP